LTKSLHAKELLLLLDLIRAISRACAGSVLTLVDVTGAQIDKQWRRGEEVLVLDRLM